MIAISVNIVNDLVTIIGELISRNDYGVNGNKIKILHKQLVGLVNKFNTQTASTSIKAKLENDINITLNKLKKLL